MKLSTSKATIDKAYAEWRRKLGQRKPKAQKKSPRRSGGSGEIAVSE